jgi:hypothetical protein
MDEKEDKQLNKRRIQAVKKILIKPLKKDMRIYWTSVLRHLQPWNQEIAWAKKTRKRSKRNGSRTF